MKDIDRRSASYGKMKSILQRAWRGSNPEKAPEIIAKIVQARSWRQVPPEQDEAYVQMVAQSQERILGCELMNRDYDLDLCQQILQEIRDSREPLKVELLNRIQERMQQPPVQEDPDLGRYVQMEMDDEHAFRKHLIDSRIYTEDTLPELNRFIIGLNALERMRVDKKIQDFPFRWSDNALYERQRQAYLRLKNSPPASPSLN